MEPVPTVDSNLVQSLFRIMDTMMPKVDRRGGDDGDEIEPADPRGLVVPFFIFSLG